MKITATTEKNSFWRRAGYLVFSWIGRQLYTIREKLETLNDWVDLQAGLCLGEDED